MSVYVEYVLLDNFIIDYLVLKATFQLTGLSYKRWRLCCCAFLGGAFAIVYPLISVHVLLLTVIKVLFGLALLLMSNDYSSPKSFYVNALVFFGYTFFTGGAVIGVFNLLGIPLGSEHSVALAVIPIYLLLNGMARLVRYFFRRKEVVSLVREVEITAFGVTVVGKGFLDSGNGLYDGERPVIVCDKRFAERFLNGNLAHIKIKRIEVNTVNGKSLSPAFKIDEIKIYNGDKCNIHNNVTICVSQHSVGEGYDVILHPALFGGEHEQSDMQIEKIS